MALYALSADYYVDLRARLHRMRVWPLNAQANIKFIILFVSNAYIAIQSIGGLLSSGSGLGSGL